MNIAERKKNSAFLLSLIMPGMGQVYNGELFKGICFFALFILTPLAGLRLAVILPNAWLNWGVGISLFLALGIYAFTIIEAYKKAVLLGQGFLLKSYNRWFFYVVLWMIGSVFVSNSLYKYSQDHVIMFCHIPSISMEPTLLKGDYVIVDKTASGHYSPTKNDIVIFNYPDDRSKIYLKRIEGLPGDTLRIDTITYIVPHGYIFVLGDNWGKAHDSRLFGPVPLSDVLGKVRQVYFSYGENGVRWNRIGKPLP